MRSLRTKMVMILVLLILALMTVIGSFLINGVGNYYIEERERGIHHEINFN